MNTQNINSTRFNNPVFKQKTTIMDFRNIVFICALFLFGIGAQAQTSNSFKDARLFTKPTKVVSISQSKADTLKNLSNLYTAADTMRLTLFFDLTSVNNLDSIKIKLGSTLNGSNLLNTTIGYDQTTGLPAGMTYSRNGNYFTIQLGEYGYLKKYYAEIEVSDISGNLITKTLK